MITISYQSLVFLLLMELIVVLFVQLVYKQLQKEDSVDCKYTVISKKTGHEYDCIAIRTCKDYSYEVKIFNYFTGEYEWCPYQYFDFLDK